MASVLLSVTGGTGSVRINRPKAMNSLNPEALDELDDAFRRANADSRVKVIVVEGDEKAFSTGADLKTVSTLLDTWPAYVGFLHRIGEVFGLIERSPIPTIAKVRGFALAGGLELLLCCDLAIAADDAKIGDQHVNFGLIAGGGGIPRLIRRIGLQPALEILYTGRWLSGKEAAETGIVLRSVPPTDLDQEVNKVAETLASKSRTSLRYIKRAARAGLDMPLETALNEERAALIEYFGVSPDPRKGIAAFLKKQKPSFDSE